MDKHNVVGVSSNALGWVFTLTQSNETYQTISLILTIVATFLTICYTIYRWIKEAKKDGQITEDEIEDIANKSQPLFKRLLESIKNLFKRKEK